MAAIDSTTADRSLRGHSPGRGASGSAPPSAKVERLVSRPLASLKRIVARAEPYDYIRVPTAILLLVAAGLKFHEMVAGPASIELDVASGPTGLLQLAAVPIEIAVAILLLVNRWPRIAWGLGVGLFAVFAVFSATGIAIGKETCGCFGVHSPSPTAALTLDLFVLFALIMVRPIGARSARWRWFQPAQRLVYVGGVGAFLLGWKGAAYQMPRPLEVDAEYLDIGEQWEQEEFKWVLPVRNTTDEPVEVTRISSSCTCTSIQPESFIVPPDGTVPVTLTLDLTNREGSENSGEVRPIGIVLTPILRGGSPAPIEWPLTGTARTLINGLPKSISFSKGSVEIGHHPTALEFSIFSQIPIARIDAVCEPPYCDAEVNLRPGKPREFTILVTPRLDGVTGYRTCALILKAQPKNMTDVMQIRVPVGLSITSDLQIIPDGVILGPLARGSSATSTIEITSRFGRPYEIIAMNVKGVSATIAEVTPNRIYQCIVTADALGDQEGHLRVIASPVKDGESFELVNPNYSPSLVA